MPRPRPPARFTAAKTWNDAAGSHAEGASSAISHVRTPASAYVAASNIPLKAVLVCEPCRETRRVSEREKYAERRAAGECGRCGTPTTDGGARCDRCVGSEAKRSRKKAKNIQSRRRYARRRARGLCIDCGEPSGGAARCPKCSRRSYVRSGEHRGIPIYPPRFTVIEIATGEVHGIWDSWDEVLMSLAFARLSREQVEVISDASPMMTFTSW